MTHNIIPVEPFDYFVFGATGDLAKRKLLPALFSRFIDGQIPGSARIIGCARSAYNTDSFRALVKEKIKANKKHEKCDKYILDDFLSLIFYHKIDISENKDWIELVKIYSDRKDSRVKIYYLSVAPTLFSYIIEGLKKHDLNIDGRLVVEKPLGHNVASAIKLNQLLEGAFDEKHIYRIDHYLGKETVQNLMTLRFANAMFEPLWNSQYIDHVQITAAETLGLQGRGEYYNQSGAMRDMVQNHLMQLLCLSAMEAPYSYSADSVRDEKLKVLRSLKPLTGIDVLSHTVRGQYLADGNTPSYLSDVGYEDSMVESYVSICAHIDNWRWSGTPFYLRTGKRLQADMAEIAFIFKPAPHSIFGEISTPLQPNALIIRLQPNERVDIEIMTKEPGLGGLRLRPTWLDTSSSSETKPNMPDAYERLLLDVVRGDQTLFMRGDEVEAAWEWIDPIIAAWKVSEEKPKQYAAFSQGPDDSDQLMQQHGRSWRKIQ